MAKEQNSTSNARSVWTSLGRAFLVLLGYNLISFGWEWMWIDNLNHISLHNGRVVLNGTATGFALFSTKANILMGTVFLWSMYGFYRQGMVSLKKN